MRSRPICPQPKFKSVEEELFNLTEDCIPDQRLPQSELECLNLNITCPADATPDSHLPVMFWIHGYVLMYSATSLRSRLTMRVRAA